MFDELENVFDILRTMERDELAAGEQEVDYAFTFGPAHFDPEHPAELLNNRYVIFHGTYDGARLKMMKRFGKGWSHQYHMGSSPWGLVLKSAERYEP